MKKLIYIFLLALISVGMSSCSDDEKVYAYSITVQIINGSNTNIDLSDIAVKVESNDNNSVYASKTDASGVSSFLLPTGVYNISASATKSVDGNTYTLNMQKSNVLVDLSTYVTPVVLTWSGSAN